MKVAIRADASVTIGSGHAMRCLTLAEALRSQGADVSFVSRALPGNCCALMEQSGFSVVRLPGDELFDADGDAAMTREAIAGSKPDWLVADHYRIGERWEQLLRPFTGRIMVIDDLADRHHDCDLLLDQNLAAGMERRYDSLTPVGCRRFLGPRYALLRSEFIEAGKNLTSRDGRVRRILVFFGGSDPTNETGKTLLALQRLERSDIGADVIVGFANPHAIAIRSLCATLPQVSFYQQVDTMAHFMARSDLALGAGGTTTWERCYLGLPSLVVVVADNQEGPARAAHAAGLIRLMGQSSEVSSEALAAALDECLADSSPLAEMSRNCLSFMGLRTSPLHDDILACMHEVEYAA